MEKFFQFKKYATDMKTEIYAGFITFITVSYVLFVHPTIMAEAGVPLGGTRVATILIATVGSLLMGLYANAPLVIAPAMGINTLFSYTFVMDFGLSWQQALGVMVVAGAIFFLITLFGVLEKVGNAIPGEMVTAIIAGIGLFLLVIGLGNSGILVDKQLTWSWLGMFGILLIFLLNRLQVKGTFLITIFSLTVLFWLFNPQTQVQSTSAIGQLSEFAGLVRAVDLSQAFTFKSLLAIFSLVIFLVFEAIGMIKSYTFDEEQAAKAYKVTGAGAFLSGIFGTSSAIALSENGAGIAEGGRTGLVSVTASVLFFISLFATSLFAYIPTVAVGPVIVMTGVSMFKSVLAMRLANKWLWLPVLLVVILIPLTGSIVDGMAYGFITYPITATLSGDREKTNATMWIIAGLFFLMLVSNRLLLA